VNEDQEKQQRIVEARLKLRQRWFEKMQASPSVSDARPMGSGPKNRHGMPQVPPGQHITKTWPVLDLGVKPKISLSAWSLVVDGAVSAPVTLDWAAFQALPQTEDVSDFHCVTTWSLLDSKWRGVQLSAVAALVGVDASATHLMTYGADGYTTNLALEEAFKEDVLLVHEWNGISLPSEHGGPVRLITPQLYAWKGAKWINRLQFLKADKRGFWEERGYSNTAHPWRDDRYA
jgi:DMSO/TMAO reductase YedYZ molybdopterin-dependent catalytic subunit